MPNFRLTDQADFGVLYDATRSHHQENEWEKITAGVVTRDAFIEYCLSRKLPSLGFTYDGKAIGGMVFDGKAAHIEVLPEFHGRWGFLWAGALEWMFSLKDPMHVAIDIDNVKCHRFMEHNNWPRISADEKFITYEMSSKNTPHYRRRVRKEMASPI